jgi:nucleotide-binding universal stress UspA family protein
MCRYGLFLADDQPAAQLLDLADKSRLVVVGTHGCGGFVGMMLGSVSTAIAHMQPARR